MAGRKIALIIHPLPRGAWGVRQGLRGLVRARQTISGARHARELKPVQRGEVRNPGGRLKVPAEVREARWRSLPRRLRRSARSHSSAVRVMVLWDPMFLLSYGKVRADDLNELQIG